MRKFTLIGLALALCASSAPAGAITVQEVKSPGGLTAYLSEDHTTPIIAISLAFRGGAALDPSEKLGLSNLASSLLDEGAGSLDSFAFQSELEDRAIKIRFSANRDDISGSLTTTTANASKAFELLHLALLEPRFDAEPVERIRRQILVGLTGRVENPRFIAQQKLFQVLFGAHVYGRDSEGEPETVKAITVDDLKAWAKSRFARDRLLISAAGDITAQDLGKALDMVFAGLPSTTGLSAKLPPAAVNTKGGTVRVAKNLPQAVVYLGQKGMMRADPDWYAATVVDYIFGSGGFTSRLMDEVREKRGLAYGVSTSLVPYQAGALMIASVATRADQVEASIGIIKDEWKKIRDGGPTEDELLAAKQYLTGAWPLRFTATSSIAEMLLAVQRDGLGLDYIDKRNSLIEGVTLEQVRRVARQLYDPQGLTVVVVGPEAKAAGGLPKERRPARKGG